MSTLFEIAYAHSPFHCLEIYWYLWLKGKFCIFIDNLDTGISNFLVIYASLRGWYGFRSIAMFSMGFYQMRKITGCACAGNAVRKARVLMHAGIAN